jgi:hypothetical protein
MNMVDHILIIYLMPMTSNHLVVLVNKVTETENNHNKQLAISNWQVAKLSYLPLFKLQSFVTLYLSTKLLVYVSLFLPS